MPQNASFADRYLKLNEERRNMDVFEWDDNILTKRLAELLASDGDFESDEEEDSTPTDTCAQSPVIEMIKRDKGIRIPSNLVVMGTVNMDETTCSFSRKVLDRAMSFELNDVEDMYTISTDGDPNVAWGAFNNGVVNRAKQTYVTAENLYAETDATKKATNMAIGKKVLDYLRAVNVVLDKTPFKVAYRTRNEMMLYCVERGGNLAKALDEVTSMKILSRIEGDTDRITEVKLTSFRDLIVSELLKVDGKDGTAAEVAAFLGDAEKVKASACCSKLNQMIKTVHEGSGFVSFWQC
jgi:hypothetical protein